MFEGVPKHMDLNRKCTFGPELLGQKSPRTNPLGHWKIVKLVSKRDLLLIFQNAMMYNSSKTDIYRMALEMERDVNQQVFLIHLCSLSLNFQRLLISLEPK